MEGSRKIFHRYPEHCFRVSRSTDTILTHSRANAFCLHLQLCVAAILSGLDTAHVMACGEIPSFMVSCAEGCPEPFRLPETLTASFSNTMLFSDIWSRVYSEISVVTAFQRYVPRAALERLISTALHESVSLAFPKVCHTTRLRKRCMCMYIYIYITVLLSTFHVHVHIWLLKSKSLLTDTL